VTEHDRTRAIGARYRARRDTGKTGWASDQSYQRKTTAFDGLIERYGIVPGARVLELGCGAGNTTVYMAERGFHAHGIDIVPEAIAWAEQKAEELRATADFRLESVTDLASFADGTFDLVFDGDCLWMVIGEDRAKCFANVFRTLKPGGILYAQAHLADPQFTDRWELGPSSWFDPVTRVTTAADMPMYQFCVETEFHHELERAGLDILRQGTVTMEAGAIERDRWPFAAGTVFAEARKPVSGNC